MIQWKMTVCIFKVATIGATHCSPMIVGGTIRLKMNMTPKNRPIA